MDRKLTSVNANGRNYGIPTRPMVVVCIDGIDPDYITHAIKAGGHPV
jgi:phosphonoacetate hydrolase